MRETQQNSCLEDSTGLCLLPAGIASCSTRVEEEDPHCAVHLYLTRLSVSCKDRRRDYRELALEADQLSSQLWPG